MKLHELRKGLWLLLPVRQSPQRVSSRGRMSSDSCFHKISLAAVLRIDCRGQCCKQERCHLEALAVFPAEDGARTTVVTVEVARRGWVETSYALKVGSIGIAYGFDVECERRAKGGRWTDQ